MIFGTSSGQILIVCSCLQRCQKCSRNTYIFRSDDPALECQLCPPSMACLNGRLLAENTKKIDVTMAVSGMSEADMMSQDKAEAVAEMMTILAQTMDVDPSLISFDGMAGETRPERRQEQEKTGVNIKLGVYPPGDKATSLGKKMLSSTFSETLQSSLAAMNMSATVSSVSEAVDMSAGGSHGWVYRLDTATGVLHLVNCPRGYLVKNDTVETQTCAECGPNTYSINPMDNCREGMRLNTWDCANRECNVSVSFQCKQCVLLCYSNCPCSISQSV